MKIAAIIDEFSPFTKEHRQFIRQVREKSKADLLIAVMSGDFLQQGIPAAQINTPGLPMLWRLA